MILTTLIISHAHPQVVDKMRAILLLVFLWRGLAAAAAMQVSRRDFNIATLSSSSLVAGRCWAADGAVVTDVISLGLSIGKANVLPLDIELYGEAAPESVRFLLEFARGELKAPCGEQSDADLTTPARVRMKQLNIERQCLDDQGSGVSLLGSSVWRVIPNKRIDFGRVSSGFAYREPPAFAKETTGLSQGAGAVSVKRGGGCFEFTVAPRDNSGLDREDLVVVGRVSSSTLATLDELNALPTKKDPFDIGNSAPPLGSNFARACEYTSLDPSCANYKPLKKVFVSTAATRQTR